MRIARTEGGTDNDGRYSLGPVLIRVFPASRIFNDSGSDLRVSESPLNCMRPSPVVIKLRDVKMTDKLKNYFVLLKRYSGTFNRDISQDGDRRQEITKAAARHSSCFCLPICEITKY